MIDSPYRQEAEPRPPGGASIVLTPRGNAICNETNVMLVLEQDVEFAGNIYFDEVRQCVMARRLGDAEYSPYSEEYELHILQYLQTLYEMHSLRTTHVNNAAKTIGYKYKRNPLQEWLSSLEWDGQERISGLFLDYFGAQHNLYMTKVSRNAMIGLVARAMKPGCKLDTMFILEGEQGMNKARALEALGGDYYAEVLASTDNKDFLMALRSAWVVEMAELSSMTRSDSSRIKAALSSRIDRYRPPYGRTIETVPRTCVLFGTTNEDAYLRDETGARRFLPVKIKRACDPDAITADRDQLFAEAVDCYRQGEKWWDPPAGAREEQAERYDVGPMHSRLVAYLNGDPLGDSDSSYFEAEHLGTRIEVTMDEVLEKVYRMEVSKRDRRASTDAARELRHLGYRRVSKRDDKGRVTKVYRLPE